MTGLANQRPLSAKASAFVDAYLRYQEPEGRQAAEEVYGHAFSGLNELSKEKVQAMIVLRGGQHLLRDLSFQEPTPVDKVFLDEYIACCFNAKQACEKSGAAHSSVETILNKPQNRVYISRMLKEIRDESVVRAEDVVKELSIIGFSDITKFVSFEGNRVTLKDSASIDEKERRSIMEVSSSRDGGVKIKLYDKIKALENLGKYLGIFNDKLEITGRDGGPIEVVQSPMDTLFSRLNEVMSKGNAASASEGVAKTLEEVAESDKELDERPEIPKFNTKKGTQ
jgi:phage terminase small subunit